MENTKYNKKVMDYFLNPRNLGKIENADGKGRYGSEVCGDVMWVYIKVDKNKKGKEIIKDIKFQTMGCAAAIATSSMITEMVKGKTLDEALKIKSKDVIKEIGGLPNVKTHCSLLGVNSISAAIEDYRSKIKDKNGIKKNCNKNCGKKELKNDNK